MLEKDKGHTAFNFKYAFHSTTLLVKIFFFFKWEVGMLKKSEFLNLN